MVVDSSCKLFAVNDKEITYQIVLNKLMHFCNYKERCESEVREKIIKLQRDENWEGKIIGFLKSHSYLDNSRYVNSFIESKIKYNKWGERKIIYELLKKGFSFDEIDKIITSKKEMFNENLLQVLNQKLKTYKIPLNTFDKRAKLFRYAYSKGYETFEINQYLDRILK